MSPVPRFHLFPADHGRQRTVCPAAARADRITRVSGSPGGDRPAMTVLYHDMKPSQRVGREPGLPRPAQNAHLSLESVHLRREVLPSC
jgi:hypothetical protein